MGGGGLGAPEGCRCGGRNHRSTLIPSPLREAFTSCQKSEVAVSRPRVSRAPRVKAHGLEEKQSGRVIEVGWSECGRIEEAVCCPSPGVVGPPGEPVNRGIIQLSILNPGS